MKKKIIYAIGTLVVSGITAFIAYETGHSKGYEKGKKFNDEIDDDDFYFDEDMEE